MTREEAKRVLEVDLDHTYNDESKEALRMAIKVLEQESCDDMVSRGVFEQVMWERDVAISQLKKLGYEFGEKIESCEDAISRQAVLDLIEHYNSDGLGSVFYGYKEGVRFANAVNKLPSVTPTCEEREKESVHIMQDELISRQAVLDLAKKGVLVSNGNYESVCKAINELPSVNPIEPCGDAIDRAEAIKIASGYCHPANVAKELAKLPPVNPTKTGHWIFDDECKEHGHCSCCGYGSVDLVDGESHNFCRNCGAKLIVESQESEE